MCRESVGEGVARVRDEVRARSPRDREAMRVLVLTGTRPELIKTASVVHALEASGCEVFLVHSGQHVAAISDLCQFLEVRPHASVNLGPRGPKLAELSARLLARLDPIVTEVAPDALVVQGDTTTAFVGALLGFYHKVPVAHVEAGLRSGDADEPFPEEMNRRLITRMATWHFAPTPLAVACLRKEGVPLKAITMTGNTVVDAVQFGYDRIEAQAARRQSGAGRLIIVTAHRRENWGAGINEIGRAMRRVVERFPDVVVLWPLHPNPEVATAVKAIWRDLPADARGRVSLSRPLTYPHMLRALSGAWLVVTDSGGLQEEAASTHVPVLIARRQTERPEVVSCGAGRLVGADARRIEAEIVRLYRSPQKWEAMRSARSPFGDGTAGRRIAAVLTRAWRGSAISMPRRGGTGRTRRVVAS